MIIWDVAPLRVAENPSLGLPGPLTVGLIAPVVGVPTLLGHCAVLSINCIRGIRSLAMLMVGGIFLTLLYTIQVLILWVVAGPSTQRGMCLTDLLTMTLLSTALLAYGLLAFIPHLDLLIGRILQGWNVICLWLLVTAMMETSWWQVLATTDLARGITWLTPRLLRHPIRHLTGRTWTLVTDRLAVLGPRNVLAGAPFVPAEAKAIL